MRMKSFGDHSGAPENRVSWKTWTKSRSLKPLSSGSSGCFRNVCFVSAKMGRENPNSLTAEKPTRKHMSSARKGEGANGIRGVFPMSTFASGIRSPSLTLGQTGWPLWVLSSAWLSVDM